MDYWFQKALYESFWPSYLASVMVALFLVPILCVFLLALLGWSYLAMVAFPAAVFLTQFAGYLCQRWLPHAAAHWAWTAGVLWFAMGAYYLSMLWDPSSRISRWQFVFSDLFSGCPYIECVGSFYITYPTVCTILFSIGAGLTLTSTQRTTDRSNSSLEA